MTDKEPIISKLENGGIRLNESLGQHLLVDNEALKFIADQVIIGANVIEVGTGPGNLTELLAQKANKVIGIEIDRKFETALDQVQTRFKNTEIIFADSLNLSFQKLVDKDPSNPWQVIGNIPYHISEPLLRKIAGLSVENIILTVGDNLGFLIQLDNPNNPSFSRLSFLAQTFFNINQLMSLEKDSFYPPPRTKSVVIELIPKEKNEFKGPRLRIQRELFMTEGKSPTVEKVLKNSATSTIDQSGKIRSKKEGNRYSRRATKQQLNQWLTKGMEVDNEKRPRKHSPGWSIENLELPANILSSPFARLNNQQIQTLAIKLKESFEF